MHRAHLALLAAGLWLVATGGAPAQSPAFAQPVAGVFTGASGPSDPAGPIAAPASPTPESGGQPGGSQAASHYCSNIQDAAAEARFAVQRDTLARLEKDIADRTQALEAKRAEYELWTRRRLEVLEKADDSVVQIYSRMRPDAAAQQIAAMDDEVAAGLLARLKPRTASAIFNEMEPGRAAHLANTLTDAPRRAGAWAESNR